MSYQKHNFTPGAVLLASQLNDMDNEIETLSQGGSGGTVLSDDFKEALLNCFENVAWINENGQTYYDALYDSLYSDNTWLITNILTGCITSNNATSILKNNSYVATITANEGYTLDGATVSISMGGNDVTNLYYSSGSINIPNVTGNLVITVSAVSSVSYITATFDQGEDIIYNTDSLDVLNQYLTVRAFYDNSESIILDYTEYELSGTLTAGTSTITVSYRGKTTTFNVTVVNIPYSLENGTHTFTNGRTITVSSGNHIVYTNPNPSTSTSSTGAYLNLSNVSSNNTTGTSSANVHVSTTFFTIPAGANVKFEIKNIVGERLRDTYKFDFQLFSNTKIIANTGDPTTFDDITIEKTITDQTDITCVAAYIHYGYSRFEADVYVFVNGERWV